MDNRVTTVYSQKTPMTSVLGCRLLLCSLLLYFAQTKAPVSNNSYLQTLVDEDQRVRTGPLLTPQESARITRTDADRLAAVKRIIAADQLATSTDFRNAAIILVHSKTSDDYLQAHTFAVIAASRGDKSALWLTAVSLDRYLISVKQAQVYGTQFNHFDPSRPFTQEPYNSGLISNPVRLLFGVPTLREQKERLDKFNKK